MKKLNFTLLVFICLLSTNLFAQISGTIYRDYNDNGTRETANPIEPLANAVIVNVYNVADVLIASYSTAGATAPNYSIPASGTSYNGTPGSNTGFVPAGANVRVEYVFPSTFVNTTGGAFGTSSGTTVKFVTAGAAAINQDFGIFNRKEFFNDNPMIAIPKYQHYAAAGTVSELSIFPYSYTNDIDGDISASYTGQTPPNVTRPNPTEVATKAEIGATYGLAWSSSTKRLYMGAYLRKKTPFGPNGQGAIYKYDNPTSLAAAPRPSLFVDINAVFPNAAGADLVTAAGPRPVGGNDDDSTVLPFLAKYSLGDIDLNNKEDTLYVVNCFDRQLYAIPTSGALNASTIKRYDWITAITSLTGVGAAGNPSFSNTNIRPFAIGINPRSNKIYVGGVYSAQLEGPDPFATPPNLRMLVWEFDPANGSFTLILNNSLIYNRNYLFKNGSFTYTFRRWITLPSVIPNNVGSQFNSPILSDIVFDGDAMVLGFRDRTADGAPGAGQESNAEPYGRGNGEILRAHKNGANWVLENDATSVDGNTGAAITSNNLGIAAGPGGDEFYFEDNVGDTSCEGGMGALLIIPGKGTVMQTAFDAVTKNSSNQWLGQNFGTNGVQVFNNTSGTYVGAYDVIKNNEYGRFSLYSGKTNGLGDIEALLTPPPIEIGNRVWNDANGDGIQNPGEAAIPGVALEIFADFNNDGIPDGPALGSSTTNAAGEWYFNNTNIVDGDPATAGNQIGLKPNSNYIVRPAATAWTAGAGAGALAGYKLTKADIVGNGQADLSDNDAALAGSGATAIPQISIPTGDYGQNNHTYDMGFKNTASLGDRVWLDEGTGGGVRNNGIQDGTEPGVAGVAVTLYQNGPDGLPGTGDDILVGSTITDAYGNYFFDNLQPSTNAATGYNVRVTPPANYVFSPQTNTTDDNNTTGTSVTGSDVNVLGVSYSIALSPGENNPNIDAGLVLAPQPIPNSIGDRVWLDQNNDGAQTAGEPGVAGVTVTLYDAAGNIYAITKTDANGNYLFNNLPPNTNFTVGFGAPAGTVLVPTTAATPGGTLSIGNSTLNSDPNPATGLTAVINSGAPGTAITGVDAGLQNDPKGALGNFVWNDLNNNGIQDAGEPGIPGVVMKLYGPGPNGIIGGGDDVLLGTTTTDANGYYVFPSLDPGKYFVQAAPIAGYSISPKDVGSATDDTKDSDFGPNGAYPGNVSGLYTLFPATGGAGVTRDMTVDMGVHSTAPVSNLNTLGDKVWNDVNKDGKQDAGEAGVPNVTVRLLTAAGAPFNNPATGKPYVVTTDANGNYKFVDLPDGDYIVEFANIPAGYSFTGQDTDAANPGAPGSATDGATDSDAKTTTGRTAIISLDAASASSVPVNIITVDAGISQGIPAGTASLGNRVWYDINNNGLQDAGELGVSNVKCELLDATGAVVNVPGTSIPYVVYTNGLGEYLFTGLPAGDYTVRFSNFPVGYNASPANAGANASDELDADATFTGASTASTTATTGVYTLQTGEDNLTVDMGIVPNAALNSLGNFVWYDTNADGIQSPGEAGVPGVTVRLYTNGLDGIPGTADDALVGVTTTDANGAYSFVGLPDGNYNVEFSGIPAGTKFTSQNAAGSTAANGSDANQATGRTGTIALDPTGLSVAGINNPDVDAGVTTTRASLGNFVWFDANADGIQDASEKGISGVTVTLYAADGVTVVASTITDANGKYLFPNLNPGTYIVGFSSIPTNLSFTKTNGPGDNQDNTNSDADPVTGKTGPIVLIAGENDLTVDAGLKPNILASVGNFVWLDKDGNGKQDIGEPGIPGVLVTLKDNLGNVVGTAITDGNGMYLIDNVKPGTGFTITFSNLPSGATFTMQNVPTSTAANGSDANSAGVTATFDLAPGQYLPDIDAGIQNILLLPIKIISFTALPKGTAVELNWTVAQQLDVNNYQVEYSANGVDFAKTITTVGASATNNAAYITTDGTPQPGTNYYRIKVINKNGSVVYSEIRKVNFGKAGAVTIYPNPASDKVNITLPTSLTNKSALISILNVEGKMISQLQIAKTGQTETVNVSSLPNGTYILRIVTNTEVVNRTIQVLR